MLNRLLIAAIAAAFLSTSTLPSFQAFAQTKAEDTKDTKKAKRAKKEKTETPAAADTKEKPKAKRVLSAKQKAAQERFRNCASVQWGEHKKRTGEKGQKAYRAFMSTCLKKKT